jgi:diguanylate cyclase (GGDEF)-like protein
MDDQVARLTEQAITQCQSSALLLLDLDKFKQINDTMGHLTGDEVLRQIGLAIKSVVRPSDLVARVGGAEFAVLLKGVGAAEAEAAGERICKVVDEYRYNANGTYCNVGVSCGISLIDGTRSPGECFSRADSALYAAKAAGGKTFRHFSPMPVKPLPMPSTRRRPARLN